MNQVLVRLWPIGLAVLMVTLPFLGPVIDHHFAERQPYHAHFGADAGHEHHYASLHSHHTDQASERSLTSIPFALSLSKGAERPRLGGGSGRSAIAAHDSRESAPPPRTIALYSFEVSSAGPVMAMLIDSELESRLTPDPDAVLTLRPPASSALRSVPVSPLERPPRA